MRKLLAVLLAVCFVFSASVVGYAGSGDVTPFSDLPQNHWAYQAVSQLQKDGVITGYDDKTYRGSQMVSRYEMAVYVAAAMQKLRSEMATKGASLIAAIPQPGQTPAQAQVAQAKLDASIANISKQDRALIQKLAAEFAAELDAMGVKVDSIQAQVNDVKATIDRAPKFSYQAQLRVDYKSNPLYQAQNNATQGILGRDAEVWIQPQVNGRISDNWNYYGEIRFIAPFFAGQQGNPFTLNGYSPSLATYEIDIRNAYVYGQALGTTKWFIGRFEDNLPFTNVAGKGGLVTDSRLDGVRAAFQGGNWRGDVFVGSDVNGFGQNVPGVIGHTDVPGFGNQAMLAGADAAYNYGKGNVYLGYYAGMGQTVDNVNPFQNLNTPLMFTELGADYQITPMVQVTAFAASSVNPYALRGQASAPGYGQGQNLSWMGRLDYGTYNPAVQGSMNFYGMYAQTGANSVWNSPNYDVSSLSWYKPGNPNVDPSVGYAGMNGNAQGFEIGMDWAPMTNMDLHLSWSNTLPIDQSLVYNALYNHGSDDYSGPLSARNIYKCEYTVFF